VFSALDSAGRVFVGPIAGAIAADYGWVAYFGISLACAIPGLLLLLALKPQFSRFAAAPVPVPAG
jgi:PAT family beta-lactamase induction signal transducer AmpG